MTPNELKQRRLEAGLTQQELAVLAGLSASTIYRIEAGERRPQRRTVRDLERALARISTKRVERQ